MDIVDRIDERIDEISLKQAYASVMTAVKKTFKSDMPDYKDMAQALDGILDTNMMWNVGELRGQVQAYLTAQYSGEVAKEFLNKYNTKYGKRRAQDR